jgi:hypothetical protein
MPVKGLPKNPIDPDRFTAHHGKSAFQCFYLNSWAGLTPQQIHVMKDVWPHIVDDNSVLIVEELPNNQRKLTFSNDHVTIICDPRDKVLRRQARESLLSAATKNLELTRTKSRGLVERIVRYLGHHGYM